MKKYLVKWVVKGVRGAGGTDTVKAASLVEAVQAVQAARIHATMISAWLVK